MRVKNIRPRAARKKSRRARGTGSIFLDKRRGGYVARVPVGRHPDGKTRYVEVRALTQAAAVEKMKLVAPPGPDITVSEWATRWLAGLSVRPSTLATYRLTFAKRIAKSIGSHRLTALTPWHIEAAAGGWAKGADALAPATIGATLARLSSCLQAAVRAGLIPRNPTSLVRRQRHARANLDLFSPAELRRIIDLAATRREWYPFALCAATGCRIGEALAISTKEDYDAANAELSIRRTWTRAGIGPPKSASGERTIRVPDLIRPLFVGTWPGGIYSTALYRWRGFLKRAGLRHRNIHQLRHSVASHALAAGVPLPNVARDLGDTVDTVVRVYLHPTPGVDVCEAMERLLGGGKVAPGARIAGKRGRNEAS